MAETTIEGVTAEIQKPPEAIPAKPRVDMTVQSVINNAAQKNAVGVVQTGRSGEQELTSQDVPVSSEVARGEIREFSKSTQEGRKARQETTQQIFQHRSGRRKVQEKIESASQRKENVINIDKGLKDERARDEQEVLALQAELRDRFSSWVHRVKEKLLPSGSSEESLRRRIDERLSRVQTRSSYWGTEHLPLSLKELDAELRLLTEQKEALQHKSKEGLRVFYERFGKQLQVKKEGEKDLAELEAYRKEQGTMQVVVDRFNVYVAHAFLLDKGGRNNWYLSPLATWKEKLIVETAERRPVSASTITEGVPRRLFSPIGVFMGEGVINDASPVDIVTVVTETGKRESTVSISGTYRQPKNIQEYENNLVKGITNPPGGGSLHGTN